MLGSLFDVRKKVKGITMTSRQMLVLILKT